MRNVSKAFFFSVFAALATHCESQTNDAPDASDDAAIDATPSDDASSDAAPAYPAPHPALPKIVTRGGPVIASPRVVPVVFENDPLAQTIGAFTKALHGSEYWKATTSEYGVGDLAVGDVVVVPASDTVPPATIDDTEIQAFLTAHLDGTHAGFTPDASTIYTVFYPEGTTVTAVGHTSCSFFGGYHRQVLVGAIHVPYAVIPRCGTFGYMTGTDAVTSSASHELVEAATDPLEEIAPAYVFPDDDHATWFLYPGSELGDMCSTEGDSFIKPADVGFVVQRSWSNALAAAGGSPCAPVPANGSYFAAAPVLPETLGLDLSSKNLGTIQTKGVTVKLGEKKTIQVDVFSSGPTKPFNVWAYDFPAMYNRPSELTLTFDEDTAQNGDHRQLTIERVANSTSYGGTPFVVLAYTDENHAHPMVGFVGQ